MKQTDSEYIPVIGLEVHIQLNTKSKLFCDDFNEFGSAPNNNVSIISLAHPGTLPVLNKAVLEKAVKLGKACHCDIATEIIFDRKNYFYPDLPKGYQITQDRTPVCRGGYIPVKLKSGGIREIALTKIHIEEDAGKSIHEEGGDESLLDFNRAGVPLLEMVTDPVINSSEEASSFLYEVRRLVRYLDVSDGNMEEGSLRCDANISVRKASDHVLGSKVEVKNLNSMKNVQKAIEHEIERQVLLLKKGESILSETRMYNAGNGKTYGLRNKETLNDYRYFPDPDLSPVRLSEDFIARITGEMTDNPWEIELQLEKDYNLPEYDASVISENKQLVMFFKEICGHTENYKGASNWIMGPIKSYLNTNKIDIGDFPIAAHKISEIINLID
ncbi:MAG: Asp-tRNA(Asn)/Glu-tRNA(Gln) amidotransferase subunit GatB, partial [Cyclobacteriaceae bacterium]|nr:Asp-tRNA(Asn)/Glu-tRNA(Gln) amidotransferase subunit GatB [Cyclobacteriaceae bacterium]